MRQHISQNEKKFPTTMAPRLQNFTMNLGPTDPKWAERLREELVAIVRYVEEAADDDNDWFDVQPVDDKGLKWEGTCWFLYNMKRYRFTVHFEIPAGYPATPIEIRLPELDGKTEKMYRGGYICMDTHFAPEWRSNSPWYGIVHAMCLALGPWLAAEIPHLVESGTLARIGK